MIFFSTLAPCWSPDQQGSFGALINQAPLVRTPTESEGMLVVGLLTNDQSYKVSKIGQFKELKRFLR